MRLETEPALRVDDPGLPTELPTGFVDKNNALILKIALDTPLTEIERAYRGHVEAA